ncbi:hypothetical protein EMA8858_02188 [Emticicia aquatica]|uniref:Uncharacterized protein n=1 Tax=Emticicia aquatica TaxID=1681835 RepID=A0ABM9AQS8_9BACT|nr:hypothetical protein EMA8858_02188 [Emticicia aquatica]
MLTLINKNTIPRLLKNANSTQLTYNKHFTDSGELILCFLMSIFFLILGFKKYLFTLFNFLKT